MTSPHIVYFGQTPDQGTGSPINMLRHLQRLTAKGWKASVVGENGQSTESCDAEGWPVYKLSLRKPWWPPFRPGNPLLRKIRMHLWAKECAGFFREPPQALFTYLSLYSELHSEVATYYSLRSGVPLSVIVYDYPPDFPGFQNEYTETLLRRQNWILQNAHQTWFVSPELADKYDIPEAKKNVLMPMPAGDAPRAHWKPEYTAKPLLIYAGYVYPVQMSLFRQLARAIDEAGGRLLILSRKSPEIEELCGTEPVDSRDLFPTNKEALEFVSSNAAALLVSYSESVEQMPWITTSFPSKFVEFAHSGLPALIVAPEKSSIGIWAKKRNYPDFFTGDQIACVRAFVENLKSEATWNKKSDLVMQFAQTEFNPDVIQAALEAKLTAS